MAPTPQFFLVRPGLEQITSSGQVLVQPGTAVPLIPADLLPEWLQVVGVPRNLSPEQTQGMINLGAVHAETEPYKLKFNQLYEEKECDGDTSDESTIHAPKPHPLPSAEKGDINSDKAKTKPIPSRSSTPSGPKAKTKLKAAKGLASSRHNPANSEDTTTTAALLPAVKLPCRHWCQSGTCKWSQFCRFQHTMPETAEGLAEVGLTRFPDWWLQAKGLIPMPPELMDVSSKTIKKKQHLQKQQQQQKPVVAVKQQKPKAPGRKISRQILLDAELSVEDYDDDSDDEKTIVVEERPKDREGLLIEI
ncbi:zinc finger DNA-binding [Fusarium albosuccineum]|uniref:Zinc finger DNA-binding n=1 Tax=Fusarium albosuccineum TaxID=1237068 RepID=A0A8H4LMI8_9HYPO|nr:zinc finger DNA-binding [Fusarium albosuccineum]